MAQVKLDPARLTFRAATNVDVPLLRRWLAEPHVARWFSRDHGDDLASAATAHDARVRPFIVSYASTLIGMIAWERLADFPEAMKLYEVTDEGAINCDVFIGEPDYIGRGLGGPIVRRFLDELVARDPQVTTCAIDPQVENKSAIRAYEKIGFRWVRTVLDGEGNTVYLMELRLR